MKIKVPYKNFLLLALFAISAYFFTENICVGTQSGFCSQYNLYPAVRDTVLPKTPVSMFSSDHSNSEISAIASNNKPAINEPVNIKIRIHPQYNVEDNRFFLFFPIYDGMKLVKGSCTFYDTIKANQAADWEVVVKFTKAMCCDVDITFGKANFHRISFYVGGAFRESQDNRDFRIDICAYKKYLDKLKVDTSDFLYLGAGGRDHIELKKRQELKIENGYDELNKDKANEWNKKHYFELKKKYNALMDIHRKKYKRPASSPFYIIMQRKADRMGIDLKKTMKGKGENIYWIEFSKTDEWPIDTTLVNLPIDSLHDNRFINYIIPYK